MSEEAVDRAVKKSGESLDGRELRIDRANQGGGNKGGRGRRD
jgi:hypothetical protein